MIHLSQAAIGEIKRLSIKQKKTDCLCRLKVQPGGCADLYYSLEFDNRVEASDQVFNCEGLFVVVDRQTVSYVDNLTIDYSEDLMGGGFRFSNPGATQTCGCGNSFFIHTDSTAS